MGWAAHRSTACLQSPAKVPCSLLPSCCAVPCCPCCLQAFTQESLDFQEKVLARSGLGEETYLPACESAEGAWSRFQLPCWTAAVQQQVSHSVVLATPVCICPSLQACPPFTQTPCDCPLNLSPPPVASLPCLACCPAAIMSQPPCINMQTAREEANLVLFSTVAEVLKATGTKAQAVDILIVNCSLFNPTPSLSGAHRGAGCRAEARGGTGRLA